jgi:methylthioribose-1-phosphate isomerase
MASPVNPEPTPGEIEPIRWDEDHLLLLDQTKLPEAQEWAVITGVDEAITAIRTMQVRGAPAIGVAAAYAMALAAREIEPSSMPNFLDQLDAIAARLAAARPTAVNLGWAVQRSIDAARRCRAPSEARDDLLGLAHRM